MSEIHCSTASTAVIREQRREPKGRERCEDKVEEMARGKEKGEEGKKEEEGVKGREERHFRMRLRLFLVERPISSYFYNGRRRRHRHPPPPPPPPPRLVGVFEA